MELRELRLTNFRLFPELQLQLPPGWTVFIGPNGIGKTTLLEAAYLLSHGRSFRRNAREVLSRDGETGFSIYGEVFRRNDVTHRLGLASSAGKYQAHIDGDSAGLSELLSIAAVLCFEPGSHELISGNGEGRRRFLDWGVFHVEPEFLRLWRRYQRALRQRNALLKQSVESIALMPWDAELAEAGNPLTAMRRRYYEALYIELEIVLRSFLGELGEPLLHFESGHGEIEDLTSVLVENHRRDRSRGYTSVGPHRADWSITFSGASRREHLSRGQEKLCALACVLAQASLYAKQHGEWPVLCLDDLASELDQKHQEYVINFLSQVPAQVLLTGTESPLCLKNTAIPLQVFHVEHLK